ncbi:MAG TPA: amino acid adenylation domain-containing protein, partial [Candidatus Deferrimicrobium sp.]|nr:amino acid adenylation domain-containing protein [Candidatus Deferrimicrobium sp.]
MEKLESKRIENILALTPLQEGILFHYLRAPQGPLYFEQLSLEISGEIDSRFFEKAWDSVIETNEMLRAVFRWEKVEKPSQIILKKHKCSVIFYDLSNNDDSRKKTALEEIKKKDRRETFDLQQVPFRVILCKLAEKEFEMVISNHHILYDGWSTGIILKEFFTVYQGLCQGGRSLKLSFKPPFKEFVTWIQNQDKNKQEQYWRDYLAGLETPTELPIKMRMEETAGAGDYSIILEGDFKKKLAVFIKNNRVTLASVFYSAWGILLQRYCGSEDVIFGTTVSGRSAAIKGIEDMVGLLINTVPLRTQTIPGEKIIDVVFRTDQELREREEFENTPLPEIRGYSSVGGSGSLFDTIVVIENYPLDSRLLPGDSLLSIHSYSMVEITHYDLTVGIMPFNEIEIKFSYKTELFEKETIENLARHFKGIVQNIVENPGVPLSQLELISGEEKNWVLYEFNNTVAVYPTNKTIHQLFVEQAPRTPDRIALVGAGLRACPAFSDFSVGPVGLVRPVRTVSLSYNELNRQSDRLAGSLIEKGVLADNIVAIMVERSIEMVAGILGILKAGGAYLPIDPEYPQGRIEYMLKDSSAKLLLTGDNLEFSFLTSYLPNFLTSHPFNLAYIIYTSGSTGKPKGVMVNHGSVVNLLFAMQDQYPFKPQDTYLLKTSYIFDVSVTELFGWYMGGGRLAVLEKGGEKDPGIILDWIERNEVTHINFVPSMGNVFIEHAAGENKNRLAALRYLFLAGETLPPELVEKSRKLGNGIALENIYGPTEGTVYAAKYSLSGWGGTGCIPIGKPLSNIEVYILDKCDQIQPIGVAGEMHIGGAGVARGYLNRPELTAEKFYRSYRSYKSNIFYKTGDLARWLNDGNIQFLGRIDSQVKIRGFRIELGEIEDRLLKHKHVKEAVVTVTENNIPQLQAYIVLKNDEPGAIEKNEKKPGALEFREYLLLRLPDYMIPAHFFLLEKIPLTPSGKINRKALQAANTLLGTGVEYISPKSDIEKTIAGVWQDLLGLDKVGIHDNFFDLGGNSLSIIRLNSRLKVALPDKKDISVVTLFNHPTVASLARYLNREENETGSVMTAKKIKPHFKREQVEIAVIGMAGRFPGAKNIDEFLHNIKNGVESIRFFTLEQLKQLGVEAELINNPDYVPAKGVLESKECFDSFFFDYTPAEAEILDPQVRLFHECTWEALENAGYDPFRYDSAVGLYAGASPNPLWEVSPLTSGTVGGSYPELWNALQFSDKDYLSTRIAYKLDLKGPCVTIQTACSTSLVAVDHACRALVSGACTIALAGGVSITVQDEGGYLYQEGTIMSPDGHCRAFDAGAGGTVGGNGVGVVVLKRLEDAEADGDTVYAVVKGFAVNNDGRNKVGFTAPSSEGQSKAIRDALDVADVNPESIGYIETHGTGTPLGDPIEMEGLKLAFNAADAHKKHYCALGSVKTNIGHLDAAAGIAGFIKTVLSLHHRFIPPSLNFKTPNPQIDFENSPFYVNTKLKTWESNEYPRRAGVSSFGLGGTNVHVVLEEYIKQRPGILFSEKENAMAVQEGGGAAPSGGQEPFCKKVPGPPKIFDRVVLLSAKTPAALEKISENLAHYFEQNPGIDLTNAAYTLQVGRKAFTHRKMLVCSDINEAILKLPTAETGLAKDEKRTIVFMFSGQGSQYVNMGLDLYRNEPVFHRQIDECFELLEKITGIAMKPVLYPGTGKITLEEAEEKIFQFKYTTPIKFIFEYSLARMLMTWGIRPDAMIGH